MPDNFSYTYSAPAREERREIENIRQLYSQYRDDKVVVDADKEDARKSLQSLIIRVNRLPKAITIMLAVIGTLIFGFGMSLVLEWENFIWGIPIGIAGIILLCFVGFIYRLILKRSQKKCGAQIVALCDELLGEDADNEVS